MLKFTNKRDVDRHVSQMTKNLSENEVILGNSIFVRGFRENSVTPAFLNVFIELTQLKTSISCEKAIKLAKESTVNDVKSNFRFKDFHFCCFCTISPLNENVLYGSFRCKLLRIMRIARKF
jgi:hypothetical protein